MASRYKIAPLDVETGGTVVGKHSLLTLYICVINEEFQVIDELDLKLKPDDGNYVVDREALEINGINLDEHDKDPATVTYSVGRRMFLEFCKRHMTGRRTLRPAGHNIMDF